MSPLIFVGGLGAVAPETAAFFDTECRSCAYAKLVTALFLKALRQVVDSTAGDVVQLLERNGFLNRYTVGIVVRRLNPLLSPCSDSTKPVGPLSARLLPRSVPGKPSR
jgi:hypothetical protein